MSAVKAMVWVRLIDAREKLVPDASLTLTGLGARIGTPQQSDLRFDERMGGYASAAVEPGDYLLRAAAEGYIPQEISVHLNVPELSITVSMGREGERYYITRMGRVYFEPEGQKVAILMQRGRRASELLPEITRFLDPERPPRRGFMVVDRARAAGINTEEMEAMLRAMPEMLDAGPLIRSAGAPDRFLSSFIEAIVEAGVTREQLEAMIRPFALHVYHASGSDPSLFMLQSDGIPGPDFGLLPEELMKVAGIRTGWSVISGPSETTAAPSPAPVAALQFHNVLTRMTGAWDRLGMAGLNRFGSSDVIIAIHDEGIATAGIDHLATHEELQGDVVGGLLFGEQTPTPHRVLYTFDFRSPLKKGNDAPLSTHGTWVAGVTNASQDAASGGVVGGAANARLCSYIIRHDDYIVIANAAEFMSGLNPGWKRGLHYAATEPFPPPFGTGRNAIPGADIINYSHNLGSFTGDMKIALQRITLFGRSRRGAMLFAAAGNQDGKSRAAGQWGENTNVMRVSASTLDPRDMEGRMNYSSYAAADDRIVDFCAPSESQNLKPFIHFPPRIRGFITAAGGGETTKIHKKEDARVMLTSSPAAGASTFNVGDISPFAGNPQVIIFDPLNPVHCELHDVTATNAIAKTVTMQQPLGYSYAAGAELIALSETLSCTTEFGGTSAATPQASAIAALMLSIRPELTWLQVRELMRGTAVPIALRYRGSKYPAADPDPSDFRYRWVDGNNIPLITPGGLLDVSAGMKTMLAGAAAKASLLIVTANSINVVPRQSLLLGAEGLLTAFAAKTAMAITVDRADDFKQGDHMTVGNDATTVLIAAGAINADVIWVQAVDGFVPGEDIRIAGGLTAFRILNVERVLADDNTNAGAASTGFKITRLDAMGAPIAGGLDQNYDRLAMVEIANREDNLVVASVGAGGVINLTAQLQKDHAAGSIVRREGTEVRAVASVSADGKQLTIDPLQFAHGASEIVRAGPVAAYSFAFGYGRLDALAAVVAAKAYSHDERDLVIRNWIDDDGRAPKRQAHEVESPDIWSRNDAPTPPADLVDYKKPNLHQPPEITVDPPVHMGTGKNDLESSGACTSAAEVMFSIEIDSAGAVDTFKWSRDGAAITSNVAITGNAQVLDSGVSIKFQTTTGHHAGDRWTIKARQIVKRFLHVRVKNVGTKPSYPKSGFAKDALATQLDVGCSRILLCATDGFPVVRFASVTAIPGHDDLQVISKYNGANPRALYTIEITSEAASGDGFRVYRDGTQIASATLTSTTLQRTLNDGVQIKFGSHTGHKIGDRWDIFARAGADAFLNLDHYWDLPPMMSAFDPATGAAGTRTLVEESIGATSVSMMTLGAGESETHHADWPEALRPATNSPNRPKATRPLRFFALGEAVPHDGPLSGFTAKDNNNFSFRELVFPKPRFTKGATGAFLDQHVDADSLGVATTQSFRVEMRTTAGTFTAERVRVRMTARKNGGPDEIAVFGNQAGNWSWDAAPAWATVSLPMAAFDSNGVQNAASGDEFDIYFDGTYTVDISFNELVIEAEILSDFRDLAVASASHTISIYPIAAAPSGSGAARTAALPKPSSFVFADMATLTQTAEQAYGPVVDANDATSATKRYRTTSLFRSASDVNAYAAVDGVVALQRDAANNDAVNLILRPLQQPAARFGLVRYFVYRGLRLTDFLVSSSDPAHIRPAMGASPFIADLWTTFLALNAGATEIPSSVLGYDPDLMMQPVSTPLDDLFYRSAAAEQLPFVSKGMTLGLFHNAAGSADFGIDIVLDDGGPPPSLDFARKSANEIDISNLPNVTAAEKFARRLAQEEVLRFIDPAAFYGLHMREGGNVDGPAGSLSTAQTIFDGVVSRFQTKHKLYVDIRNEHASSFNFQNNYDIGGNQIQTGATAAAVTPQPYATEGWPIVIADSMAPAVTPAAFNEFHLQLALNDNEEPVLYVHHGDRLSSDETSRFTRNEALHAGADPWTLTQSFQVPNSGATGSWRGAAWMLRLQYGRLEAATPVMSSPTLPATVLKTDKYADNVFGPVDRGARWVGNAGIKWALTQENRYVDADSTHGWRQMVTCGVAEQSTGPIPRALFYAVATASDTNADTGFVPLQAVADGASDRTSFFDETGLFGVYSVERDAVKDGGGMVTTLQLRQNLQYGYSPTSALLLGLSKAELTALRLLAGQGLSTDYLRTIFLDGRTPLISANGKTFDRYRVGLQGLKSSDSEYAAEFPATDTYVYTADGQFFASNAFAMAEPISTAPKRSPEEEVGTQIVPARTRKIASSDPVARSITIAGYDWRPEVVPGATIIIADLADPTSTNSYIVTSVTLQGSDTIIGLAAGNALPASTTLSASTIDRHVEDFFIDLDQQPALSSVPKMRDLIGPFLTDLDNIQAVDPNPEAAILAKIVATAPKILERARALAKADRTHADDHDRMLYWARIRMSAAVRSHDVCLASTTSRDNLLEAIEQHSRGYDLTFTAPVNPTTSVNVLLTGFDPFGMTRNLPTTLSDDNPSSAVTLALDGEIHSTNLMKKAVVKTAIFPVRYADFDAGRVEILANAWLNRSVPDPSKAQMILTVSQTPWDRFDLERFAGRRRKPSTDNNNQNQKLELYLGDDATHKEFYETTLPVMEMVPGPFNVATQVLFYNQAYMLREPNSALHIIPHASGVDNTNTNTVTLVAGKAIEGSGGAFLSNEIFYRIAYLRETLKGTAAANPTLTGHFHVPKAGGTAAPSIKDVVDMVETLIRRWLDSLP